jgi:hypothetical protein
MFINNMFLRLTYRSLCMLEINSYKTFKKNMFTIYLNTNGV